MHQGPRWLFFWVVRVHDDFRAPSFPMRVVNVVGRHVSPPLNPFWYIFAMMYQRRTVPSSNSYKEENPFTPNTPLWRKLGFLLVTNFFGSTGNWVTELYRFGWLLGMDDLCPATPNGTGNSDIPNSEPRWSSLYIFLGALHIVSFRFRNTYRIVSLYSSLGDLTVCIYIFYYTMLAFTFRS